MEKTDLAMSLDELKHMPRYLGKIFYWQGFPFNTESLMFKGVIVGAERMPKTLKEIISDYNDWLINSLVFPTPPKLVFEILREYCIYYAHAPIWQRNPYGPNPDFDKWVDKSFKICDWDSLFVWRMQGLDFGLDPL